MTLNNLKSYAQRHRMLLVLVSVFVVAAVVLSVGISRQRAAQSEYFTAAVERNTIRLVVNATGTVQAVVTVQVGSQVSAQIQNVYADYNSVVKRGDLLARMDPRNFEAQLDNAKANLVASQARVQTVQADLNTQRANLQSAQANLEVARVARDNTKLIYNRYTELRTKGILSQNEFDTAKANADSAKYDQAGAAVEQVQAQINATKSQLDQAKAQVQQARADLDKAQINLGYTKIYSPIDGVVVSRNIDVGQTVAASLQAPTLFVIANDLTKMQVNASIDEADIGKISDQVDVKFTVDAYPNESFMGRILEIRLNPQTVQNVVTYNVIIGVDNPQLKLKPGMTANISITVNQKDNVLNIPNASLRYAPAGAPRNMDLRKPQLSQGDSAGQGERRSDKTQMSNFKQQTSSDTKSTDSQTDRRPPLQSNQAQGVQPGQAGPQNRGSDRSMGAHRFKSGTYRPDDFSGPTPSKNNRPERPHLAPGQNWDPEEKIKFPTPSNQTLREAIVWVLNGKKKATAKQVTLGITDGVRTEVVAGELNEGDQVIIGDTSQTANNPGAAQSPFGRPMGGFGPPRPIVRR